jgi:hypothetical protein
VWVRSRRTCDIPDDIILVPSIIPSLFYSNEWSIHTTIKMHSNLPKTQVQPYKHLKVASSPWVYIYSEKEYRAFL